MPACPSVCLPTRLYVCLPTRLSACLPARLSVCLPVYLPVCPSVCLPVCMFACLLVCRPACLPARLSAGPPVCMSAILSVCLSVCLPVCPSALDLITIALVYFEIFYCIMYHPILPICFHIISSHKVSPYYQSHNSIYTLYNLFHVLNHLLIYTDNIQHRIVYFTSFVVHHALDRGVYIY